MDIKFAKVILSHLRDQYKQWETDREESGQEHGGISQAVEAFDILLNAVDDEDGFEVNSIRIIAPNTDLCPFEHLDAVGKISDFLSHMWDEHMRKTMDETGDQKDETVLFDLNLDDFGVINTALTVYKTVLMALHKNRMRDELREVLKRLGRIKEDDGGNHES